MPFKIMVLNQEIANIIGDKEFVVTNNPVTGSVVSVGGYTTHLTNVLIQEV